jgi:mannose-binding lectin 2
MRITTLPLLVGLCAVRAAKEEARSFHEPFETLDGEGKRTVPGWLVGGDAAVEKGFVRLTTDRQSKKGHLWNSMAIGRDEFSAIMQFRISGQGAKFFGDGIGLWFTQDAAIRPGNLHGVMENFVGVGIVIDTFKNTESAAHHKDISVLMNNDGSKTIDQLQQNSVGCDAKLRYHEKRADFGATNSSRIKVQYSNGQLRIGVDEKADGDWRDCVTVAVSEHGLSNDWSTRSFIGVTATTGQLADNHDILALESYGEADDQYADYKDEQVRHSARPLEEQHGGDQVEILKAQMGTMQKELEHKLSAVNEGLKHSLMKLQKQEEAAEKRIEQLEAQMQERISSHVEAHVEAAKGEIHNEVSNTVQSKLSTMSAQVSTSVSKQLENVAAVGGGGWKLPFLILFVIVVGASGWTYSKYREFKKSHLL